MGKNKEITKRDVDYSSWYQDVIEAADLAEHSPIKGCMVIKPTGYAIWERMQQILDAQFKIKNVKNAYFPLFIPESFLKREAKHVEGFSPELAVVTHAGGQKLAEPLVVRPTSETIIYETYSKWIKSYRDLPMLINQWANVVRWELRTRLFLRTTEFLWQEGHTVHVTEEEADKFAQEMLGVYKKFAEEYLAIPVIPGRKTDQEKFAGAKITYTVEAMMQDGKALQMGTSHNLGQNFAKAFNIKFLDKDETEKYGWQTSWGVSTRLIGALIMAHSDDRGLVLPPKIAPTQVVIVSIFKDDLEKTKVINYANKVKTALEEKGIRVILDDRDKRPGEKFYEWEQKGIPVRIEIGPRDIDAKMTVYRRDTQEKEFIDLPMDNFTKSVKELLDAIQDNLYNKSLEFQKCNTVTVDTWDEFEKAINEGKFVLAHWCGESEIEKEIKAKTKATIRCIAFDQKKEAGKCILSGKESTGRVIFAKAY